ncbi:hypothetical protein D915_009404 [Fasciola hepatica]|uniref:Asparaginase n=2 Tax=Fasciola TaxID=6191 RepID=A0A4E0QXA9_FASHE|nr:hypothetical protein D915_009404 [Fasciola hepatica]
MDPTNSFLQILSKLPPILKMSQSNIYVNGETDKNPLAWCMSKIDEFTKASCLSYPSIDPFLLDAAVKDNNCSSVASILVLYTGGTIGMRPVDGAYQPVPNYLVKSLIKMPTFNDPQQTHAFG